MRELTPALPLTKAEALRRTQLAFLSGTLEGHGDDDRGTLVPVTADSGKLEAKSKPESGAQRASDYRHPYYWAPFILMGNWL